VMASEDADTNYGDTDFRMLVLQISTVA
jgi:hypothetical protein